MVFHITDLHLASGSSISLLQLTMLDIVLALTINSTTSKNNKRNLLDNLHYMAHIFH